MKKQLPQVKKSLKTFILDDDAKVIDKAATKIALTSSFMAITIIANSNDAHAGHSNHTNHANNLNAPENFGTDYHGGNNPLDAVLNGIEEKGVDTLHSNHYNHQNVSGGQSGFAMIIGAIVAVVAVAATAGAGLLAVGGAVASFSAVGVGTGMTALVSGIGVVAAGGAAAGSLVTETPDTAMITTGDPYHVTEEILRELQDEES
ncbi:MAG: hypothetical protein PF569_06545 [Candidatus Woesearchaeota archaeon]|jgi:hypothetical protein|nr:hypothetical protein [Candidatus Woesearchaeota archaeon]